MGGEGLETTIAFGYCHNIQEQDEQAWLTDQSVHCSGTLDSSSKLDMGRAIQSPTQYNRLLLSDTMKLKPVNLVGPHGLSV